jgi:PKD repeat protein
VAHRASILLLLCAVLVPQPAAARRRVRTSARPAPRGSIKPTPEQLLRVITPIDRQTAAAHPSVNVIVRFGETGGVTADPATFRVRLKGANVTALFAPIRESGAVVGMRAALPASLLKTGRHLNHLRLEVRGQGTGRAAQLGDVDSLRFRVADRPDQPPVARALASSDVIVPDIPLQFDGTQSSDPELDVLSYHWDFGDGTTSADPRPIHTFAANVSDVPVRLTVSDGQLESTTQLTMLAVPSLDPGRTPGILKVDALAALEFGGVSLGGGATRTFTVRNGDATPTSELKVRLGMCDYVWSATECEPGEAFALDTLDLDLGPSESALVNLTFTPGSPGHQSAQITVAASASNQRAAHLLSHGYGGAAQGTGPLPTADRLFYTADATGMQEGIFPSGARFVADTTVHACSDGQGAGDDCLTDADCAANGGTCLPTSSCVGGARVGQPCATPADCPGGSCPSATPFDPIDMDGDGEGGLYLLSDDGTFTDPNPNDSTMLDGTVLSVGFDASGARTGAQIVARTPMCTTQMASDAVPAAAGGEVYLAWYQSVSLPAACIRSELEELVAFRKSDGMQTVLVPRIDAVEGLDPCNDDYDPADDLEVARDGSAVFAALPGGIYRIRPTPLLITPDVDDVFAVHPDGSIIVVTSTDEGPHGLLSVYKISPDQAVNGAPHLSDLTPCATIEVPNDDAGLATVPLTVVDSFAVDPVAPRSADATILVSFFSTGGASALSSTLQVTGTLAIGSPAGTSMCNVIGLTNLEALDQMTF